jgi:hypothetical protein
LVVFCLVAEKIEEKKKKMWDLATSAGVCLNCVVLGFTLCFWVFYIFISLIFPCSQAEHGTK